MWPSLKLRYWMVGSHLVVLALPLILLLLGGTLQQDLMDQTEDDLRHQAALISLWVSGDLQARGGDLADAGAGLTPRLIAAREANLAGVRLIGPDGRVVASSGDQLGDDLSDRPEVQAALAGETMLVVRDRPMPTRNPIMSKSRRAAVRLFLGHPIADGDVIVGAVVLSRTPREEVQAMYQLTPWWGVGVGLFITLAMAWTAGWGFTRSLSKLELAASRLAEGSFADLGALERPGRSRVAEVRGLAVAFGTMTQRLKDRLGYITEFAGNVAHEFRTPISALRGAVELLGEDDQMPPAQRTRFLGNALADLDRMDRLVGGLLGLARAEEGAAHVAVDLDALLARVVAQHTGVDLEGSAGEVQGHAGQLETVVGNLLDNARRYGGEQASVSVRAWREGGEAGFDVLDDGPGITPANRPQVFDRFFTTGRGRGGIGLGLALVQAVCRAHGGEVELESAPGRTRFRCRLPTAGLAPLP